MKRHFLKRFTLVFLFFILFTLHYSLFTVSYAVEPPQRIISLAPATTEILFALGLGERIVGVTNFCDYPEEAKKKPKVGGMSNPSLEAVVSLKPDIVVMSIDGNPKEFEERLRVNEDKDVCVYFKENFRTAKGHKRYGPCTWGQRTRQRQLLLTWNIGSIS